MNILWEQYHKQLLAFILRRVSNKKDAEDILHEVFIKIHKNIGNLKEESKFRPWIFQITRNLIIDFYRKEKLNFEFVSVDKNDIIQDEDEELLELNSCIVPMINSLPKLYSHVLIQIEIEGKSQKQLANEINVSYSTIKSRVQRGRLLLKNALKKCCSYNISEDGKVHDLEKKQSRCSSCKDQNCQ